ncbi:NADP-binding protein [Dacryopinax primogenitus]|uniref:NADP-binding protein n=1 Tax=Dacryopinax primogenitus (strain DJM 731) TaxID=1858805 RepID=M5GBP5_DACPD|nr:NADP-binding protein [Dacryopinax primogenitus]EJU05845.1 NADP-binding protein [Dacryopinax primogenitus]
MDLPLPQFQKGWQIVKGGVPKDVLKFRDDLPVPSELPKGHVLVKVLTAALNPVGYKSMSLPSFVVKRPRIAEHDLAGEIVLANDTEFNVGNEVFGLVPAELSFKTGWGSMQEYAIVPAEGLVLKPSNIDFTTAAGIGLAGQTAYEALIEIGKLEEGQRVFVNGGSSSVGTFAIQIAKAKGARVDCSASANNFDYVKSFGVEQVFDYHAKPLEQQLIEAHISPPYNIIFDCVDATVPLFVNSAKYLAPNGVYVSTGPNVHDISGLPKLLHAVFRIYWPRLLGGVPRSFKMFLFKSEKYKLQYLADLVSEGKLKPPVDSVFAFPDLPKAYERILSGHAKGKIVVQLL